MSHPWGCLPPELLSPFIQTGAPLHLLRLHAVRPSKYYLDCHDDRRSLTRTHWQEFVSSCAAKGTASDLGEWVARFYDVLNRMADLHNVYKVPSLPLTPHWQAPSPLCHGRQMKPRQSRKGLSTPYTHPNRVELET